MHSRWNGLFESVQIVKQKQLPRWSQHVHQSDSSVIQYVWTSYSSIIMVPPTCDVPCSSAWVARPAFNLGQCEAYQMCSFEYLAMTTHTLDFVISELSSVWSSFYTLFCPMKLCFFFKYIHFEISYITHIPYFKSQSKLKMNNIIWL